MTSSAESERSVRSHIWCKK